MRQTYYTFAQSDRVAYRTKVPTEQGFSFHRRPSWGGEEVGLQSLAEMNIDQSKYLLPARPGHVRITKIN